MKTITSSTDPSVLSEIKSLSFDKSCHYLSFFVDAEAKEDPITYINLINQMTNLEKVFINYFPSSVEESEHLIKFVSSLNENVQLISLDTADSSKGISGQFVRLTKDEFIQTERLFNKIVKGVDPNWTTIQKILYIHCHISDFSTYRVNNIYYEQDHSVDEFCDNKSIYKTLTSGNENVCLGMSTTCSALLARLGVSSERLFSEGNHVFLLSHTENGNIITDPTWDLCNTLYGLPPKYFGVTYEELLSFDGDSNSHTLKNSPENVIKISSEEIKSNAISIGLHDGNFWLHSIIPYAKQITEETSDIPTKTRKICTLLTTQFSEQCPHLCETQRIILSALLTIGVNLNDVNTDFIYNNEDSKNQNPKLVFHINNSSDSQTIFMLNTQTLSFEEYTPQEIAKSYRLHTKCSKDPFWNKLIMKDKEEQPNHSQDFVQD